jgi:hypothetical protein
VPKSTPNPPYQRLDEWLAKPKSSGPKFIPQSGDEGGALIKPWYAIVGLGMAVAGIIAVIFVRRRNRVATIGGPPPTWGNVPGQGTPPGFGQPPQRPSPYDRPQYGPPPGTGRPPER